MMPLWVRTLAKKLRRKEVVERLSLHYDRIHVVYKTGVARNYCYREPVNKYKSSVCISRDDGQLNRDIPIIDQYPDSTGLSNYFFVNRKQIDVSSTIEIEVLVQRLFGILRQTGWLRCLYSDQEVYDDLMRVDQVNRITDASGTIRAHPPFGSTTKPGRLIVERYFDYMDMRLGPNRSSIRDAFHNPKLLLRIVTNVVYKTKWDISISSITRMAYKNLGPWWICPAVYKGIFNMIGDKKSRTICDLHPNLGEKAVACALQGHAYTPLSNELGAAVKNGFDTGIGLNLRKSNEPHDVLVSINRFRETDITELQKYSSNTMVVFVKNHQHALAKKLFNAYRIIGINPYIAVSNKYEKDYVFYCK